MAHGPSGSFGLVFDPGTTRDEVAIAKKYGFSLQGNYDQKGTPNCYAKARWKRP